MPANFTDPPSVAGESSTQVPVDVRRFPWIRRLAGDYAYDFPSVAPFFAGDPSSRDAWVDAVARARTHPRDHTRLAAIITAQQERRGAPLPAREAGRRLADKQTVAVVTGQQAGLFGGPLFTLLKAMTALKLAARLTREQGVPAVAVFWVDAEDHDWNEVRSCTVLDASHTPRTVTLAQRPPEAAPVATVRLEASVQETMAELERALAPTEFRADLLATLRSIYAPGAGMADAFARWMESVLGDRGLVVYDSSDPEAKPLAARIFSRELSNPGETTALALEAGHAFTARGYHAQIHDRDSGSVALFRLDGGRHPIRHSDGRFVIDGDTDGAPLAPEALVQEASERPGGFSPNVLLRPVVQDTLFPTVCYVAGPNELAYLGQLKHVYERFGIPMPLMYPRSSATLADSAALRFLRRYELPVEALRVQDEAALNALLESQMPADVETAYADAVQHVNSCMSRLIETMPSLDPTLEGAARSTLGRMQHDLDALRGKMIQTAKRRDETLRRQYNRTQALMFPNGEPQERAIGFVSFMNQYGPALVERLDEALPLDPGHHWIVSI